MKRSPGTIGWFDIAVPDATALRDFYAAVVGWKHDGFDMGGYEDYCMVPPGASDPVAGICHARGPNTGLPACWLMYITVEDVDASAKLVSERGGTVLVAPKQLGSMGRVCIIRDPAGAHCALFQPTE
jgi:uncharacterized protein